jgi:hypothetical protein
MAPPEPIPEMPEDDGANGPREETDGERRQRRDGGDQRAHVREERLVDDEACYDCVEEEVVPLDDRAHDAGDEDLLHALLR